MAGPPVPRPQPARHRRRRSTCCRRGRSRSRAGSDHFIVENAKPARAFLKSLDPARPLREIAIAGDRPAILAAALRRGAACARARGRRPRAPVRRRLPGIADPGARVVAAAHRSGIAVVPLVGPSAVLLALMASGMNGQGFVFHGYLPVKPPARAQAHARARSRIAAHRLRAALHRDAVSQRGAAGGARRHVQAADAAVRRRRSDARRRKRSNRVRSRAWSGRDFGALREAAGDVRPAGAERSRGSALAARVAQARLSLM